MTAQPPESKRGENPAQEHRRRGQDDHDRQCADDHVGNRSLPGLGLVND
jgi:hypothetical protein